jgi:predicted amidohydrolase YtcJ
MAASLVIKNAKVVTVDAGFSIAEAIAIDGDTIVAVGCDADVSAHVGRETKVLDLGGKTIMPGVNDTHGHAALFGGTRPPLAMDLYAPRISSAADVAAEVKQWVGRTAPGEWIRGYGWDPQLMPSPSRFDVDAVSLDNPIVMNDWTAHSAWVNTKALELAGITRDTPDPEGGIIERDGNGEPTGVFRELSAIGLVMKVVPLLTKEEKRAAIISAMQTMNMNGITSYTDSALGAGGNTYSGGLLGQECADIYVDLAREGKLTARLTVLALFGEYGAISLADLQKGMAEYAWPAGLDEKWLRFPGVKIFADGIPHSKTSAMLDEYEEGGYGTFAIPGATEEEKEAALTTMIRHVCSTRLQVGVHVTGDRAARVSLDALEAAIAADPAVVATRPYLIHANQIKQSDLDRAGRLGVALSMQPGIQIIIADMLPIFLGRERTDRDWPYRGALDAGIMLSCSSDLPVTYPDWRLGVQGMVLREGVPSGVASGPDECVSREEAIRCYTLNGAWQDLMEDRKGSIEVGKLADFCVLSDDILTCAAHAIKDISVTMTIVGGEVVYEAAGA